MRAWKDLVTQVEFGPRKPGTKAHKDCRDYIVEELRKTCENVRLQGFRHIWGKTGQPINMWNVIGEQGWKDASIRVAVLAHWDSRPQADQETDPVKHEMPIPGADDGASGVAVLLELARALKAVPAKVGVMYIFLDGEDLGPGLEEMFLGAKILSVNLPTPKPDYGILLDMIGNKGVVVPKEPNSEAAAPELMKELYLFAAKIGYRDTFPNVPGETIEDDHLALNHVGMPTIDLIDFMGYQPYWHTLQDTPDKCSPDSLDKMGDLLEQWLRRPDPFKIK